MEGNWQSKDDDGLEWWKSEWRCNAQLGEASSFRFHSSSFHPIPVVSYLNIPSTSSHSFLYNNFFPSFLSSPQSSSISSFSQPFSPNPRSLSLSTSPFQTISFFIHHDFHRNRFWNAGVDFNRQRYSGSVLHYRYPFLLCIKRRRQRN